MIAYGVVQASADVSTVRGLHGAAVGLVTVEGLALVVSLGPDVPATSDPHAYAEAVDALAARTTCIPLRAAARPLSIDEAERFLRSGSERLRRLLRMLDGCDEWTAHIEGDPTLGDDGADDAAGRGYLRTRRRAYLQRDGVTEAAAWLDRTLRSLPTPGLRRHRAVSGKEVALLIERDRTEACLASVERLIEVAGHSATISGPWPAWSFVSIDAAV